MSEQIKYTPGPWTVSTYKHNEQRPSIISQDANSVWFLCRMDDGCPNVHENARLIAAAPELLEALKHSVRFVRAFTSTVNSAMDDKWATLEQCEAAIAKAEGGAE